jgi:hypothetical protein
LVNTIDCLIAQAADDPEIWDRIATDLPLAQRSIHETLRLRPTTPRIKRRAVVATHVGTHEIPESALVIIDVESANRDRTVFGDSADRFDPSRSIPQDAHPFGLTFGAGQHQCPGRNVAVGLPISDSDDGSDRHLFGLVSLMLKAVAVLVPGPDPDRPPVRDTQTVRWTRWKTYPVTFNPKKGGIVQ